MTMHDSSSAATGQLVLELGFAIWYFPLLLVRPVVALDGSVERTRWGAQVRTLPAGRHTLTVWYRWLIFPRAGLAELAVDVPAGRGVRVRYRPLFSLGESTLVGRLDLVASALPPARLQP